MSEYIGSKVKVKCKKNGDIIGYVDDVTDDQIILTSVTASSLPGVKSKCLILKASDILDLDLVDGEQKGQSSTEAPSTRCAYVCPTTPVRPMRPMRVMKGEDAAAIDTSTAVKPAESQDSKRPSSQQKQQIFLKPQPQAQAKVSSQPNDSAQQERSPNATNNQQRRRAFSANYESAHVNVGRGMEMSANVSGRRASRTREPWFEMSVAAMQEEFDFESNLRQFDKDEFYRQVDAENQRQNVSPITIRNKPGSGDSNVRRGGKMGRGGRDSCFDMDVSQMHTEFDFEGNLAQFNKSEFYREVDERRQAPRRPDVVPEPKFRHDENVLPSAAPVRQPIALPAAWQSSVRRHFACPDGLLFPSCPVELRQSLFTAAETLCLPWASMSELYARAVSELVLDQVGGKARLRPGNEHQLPHIVVLAGQHIQGSLGVAVARHLRARRASVSLVVPQMKIGQMEPPREMAEQRKLYENLTGDQILTDFDNCPSKTTDFIVSAIESHEDSKNELLLFQPWISQLITFCNANRPPCLVVDPPPGRSFIRPRLMVGLGLPLAMTLSKATYYLCDVGLTSNVYQRVGISYVSPFSCRSILQLSEMDEEDSSSSSSIHR